MFDKSIYKQSVNIKSACSGMLQKSHPNSFFLCFHRGSEMANWIFNPIPTLKRRNGNSDYYVYMNIVVSQVMTFGDGQILCELVDSKEFESNKPQ